MTLFFSYLPLLLFRRNEKMSSPPALHFVHKTPEHSPFLGKDHTTVYRCVKAFGHHLHLPENESLPQHCWSLESRHGAKRMPGGASQEKWIMCHKSGTHSAEFAVNITTGGSHYITMPNKNIIPFETVVYQKHTTTFSATSHITVCYSKMPFPDPKTSIRDSSASAPVESTRAPDQKQIPSTLNSWRVLGKYTPKGGNAAPYKPFAFVRAAVKGSTTPELLLQIFCTKRFPDTVWLFTSSAEIVECVASYSQKEHTLTVKQNTPAVDINTFRQRVSDLSLKPYAPPQD